MKIAEIVATFPPYHGGMGYVCYHNARLLAELGHEVTVFTLDHRRLEYHNDPSGFRIVRLRTPLRYGDGGAVPQLLVHLREFDLLHLHYPFFGGAEYVWLASKLFGKKLFLTYHMDVTGTNLLKRAIMAMYQPLLNERIIGAADGIGAVSIPHLRSSAVASVVRWDRVVEVPNGVDTAIFAPREKDPELVERYGLRGRKVLLFVGNLQPMKGLDILLRVMATTDVEDLVLLIVGGGYSEDEYRQLAQDLKLRDKVIFAGAKSPDEDLAAHYNLGDCLVLPSTSESFGLVILEAMASGLPAIVSALPGPSLLVTPGVDGYIAKVGDPADLREKIQLVMGDMGRCRQMGEAARAKAVGFSWSRIGSRLEEEFARLLKP